MLLPLCPTQILPQSIITLCLEQSRDLRRCKERKLNNERLYYILIQKVAKLTFCVLAWNTFICPICQPETVNTNVKIGKKSCALRQNFENPSVEPPQHEFDGASGFFCFLQIATYVAATFLWRQIHLYFSYWSPLKNAPINPPGVRRSHNGKTDGSATLQRLTRFNCHNCSFVATALAVCHWALNTHFELSYPI